MENKDGINILIIAYAFPPDKRVGALRAGYWYKELANECNCTVSLVTAEQDAFGKNVHVVPKHGSSVLGKFIKDEGLIWRNNIKTYLKNTPELNPDIVIITGGPFMHFSLTGWLKQRYNAKVILDYRDPFSKNPGFGKYGFKTWVKSYFERQFNLKADALITVNTYCSDLVMSFKLKPHAIIQNGYDETVTPELTPVELKSPTFSYTGKFYFDPEPILDAIIETGCEIHLAGPDTVDKNYRNNSEINVHGFVNYADALQLIANNDVGIIQTYGEDFQSTTKIFDYVRCVRAILIVSNKYIERGSIHEELKGYPNVYWTKNTKEDIVRAIEKIKSATFIQPPEDFHNRFSRKNQMKKLIQLIQEIK